MTRLLFYLLALFFQSGDWLYVTNIRGSVRSEKGDALAIGDSIRSTQKLLFGSYTDQVVALHPLKGRFVIKDLQQRRTEQGKLDRILVAVSDMVPSGKIGLTAGRSAPIQSVAEFSSFLHSHATRDSFRLVLVDNYYIPVAFPGLADSAQHFFYLQYDDGVQAENVKVPMQQSGRDKKWQLVFNRQALPKQLTTARQPAYTATLFYYDARKGQSDKIGNLYITVLTGDYSRKEYKTVSTILARQFAGKPGSSAQLQQEIQQYFIDRYVLYQD